MNPFFLLPVFISVPLLGLLLNPEYAGYFSPETSADFKRSTPRYITENESPLVYATTGKKPVEISTRNYVIILKHNIYSKKNYSSTVRVSTRDHSWQNAQ